MRVFRLTVAMIALVLLAVPASAGDREVMGDELATLLTGNSINGMWGQGHYVQFFQSNGRTVYVSDGSAPDWGTWRISSAGRYCSVWRGGGESCYPVIERDGGYYWLVESSGAVHPFDVVEGNITLQ
ncbi:MAG: hypothetical protein P8Q36_15750 [Alphaproteobacteria bacterium]|nr:hypothetical protein [Rhodospirillaceae bacterium]MDG2482301.1 hypothetical protein [Alphaproteobacteria bacterium]MBT6206185.1 hypothetical protein [Rhodospirillaceae bacterium]MBT6509775.1 hypothetical protein [Rhodospirillaceae bacterium]MBT7612388.1 hypothetical protein [Rhodospirillaceae bacterium]